MFSRFHDKVVIEEELNMSRQGEEWEHTKYHLKEAKFLIESAGHRRRASSKQQRGSKGGWDQSATNSRTSSLDEVNSSVVDSERNGSSCRHKPVLKPELHM